MSGCSLRISLDRANRTYAVGEKVQGVVEVDARGDCECRKLTLHREWRTHGKGDVYSGGEQEWVLFSGMWTGGEHASYRFEFIAPRGPLSYHGHVLSVAWYIRAHADLAHTIDHEVEEEFLLVPGEAPGGVHTESAISSDRPGGQITFTSEDAKKMGGRGYAGFSALLVVSLGVCLWLLWRIFAKGMPPHWDWRNVYLPGFFALFSAVLAVTSAALVLSGLKFRLAQKKLGAVRVELSPKQVRPGETVTCRIMFRPLSPVELKAARVRWWGVECATRSRAGSDPSTTLYTHTLFDSKTIIASRRDFMPGQDVSLEGKFQIPHDAPSTLKVTHNELYWWAEVIMNLKHCPDWSDTFEITVRP